MKDNDKIKIFVAYHKEAQRLKSDILTPIHVGRASASDKVKAELSDMSGDDTGDNISAKNKNYCELTALYQVWKNCDADYIGFMHYRRHLNFNTAKKYKTNRWGLIDEPILNDEYLQKFGLQDSTIKNVVTKYDIVLPEKWKVKNAGSKNNYDHYKNSSSFLHIKDYDKALEILVSKYPQYKQAAEKYNNSRYGYYTNMFVMKKDIFNEYCSWMFSILFDLESQTDITNYDKESARIYGYISEWLTGIFITYKQMTSDVKIKELQRTFVHCTDTKQNIIPVCFSSDDNYFMPLYAAVYSLLKNKNINDIYKLNVIDGGITEKNKQLLNTLVDKYNAEIKFVKIDTQKFKDCPVSQTDHVSIATYYRFLLPELLPEYDKIIYLDCDLIVRTSLADLYNTDLNGNYLGGVVDILYEENAKRLNLEKYINAGVLLINLKKWREDNITKKLFEYTAQNSGSLKWWDQDVLNAVLQSGLVYLDEKWNLQTSPYFFDMDYKEYLRQHLNTAIIHYITPDKPWQKKTMHPLRNEFYRILRKTPFKQLYLQCKFYDLLKKIFAIKYKGDGTREFRFCGIFIYSTVKTETQKKINILNLIKTERQVKNA